MAKHDKEAGNEGFVCTGENPCGNLVSCTSDVIYLMSLISAFSAESPLFPRSPSQKIRILLLFDGNGTLFEVNSSGGETFVRII